MNRQDLRYFDSLGQGWFGWIVRGRHRKPGGGGNSNKKTDQSVIVCMLKEEANAVEKRTFLEETQFAAQFSFFPEDNPNVDIIQKEGSRNVIKLVGVCVESPPFLSIYEECEQGDLKTFLFNSKGKIQNSHDELSICYYQPYTHQRYKFNLILTIIDILHFRSSSC